MRDDEWRYFTEDGKETKGFGKDGKKWSGEFWINVKTDSVWVETKDETPDDDKVWRGLFTYDDGEWSGWIALYRRDGKKMNEGLWKNGMQGKWVSYGRNERSGEIIDEYIFKDGECIEMCEAGE